MTKLNIRWWLTVVSCLSAFVAVQVWSGLNVKNHTEEFQSHLDQAYSLSLGLTRSLGYGGLIHNLKDQVLRPLDQGYTIKARQNAADALVQVKGLEELAQIIGVKTTLSAIRTMIEAYSDRLTQMHSLVRQGLGPIDVDAQIQFDDHLALDEIDALMIELKAAVGHEIESVSFQASALHWMSTTATAILILILLVQRAKRTNDLQSISVLNHKLSDSVSQLGEANVSLKQFAGIVSHDLKAPLRHIGFYSSLINEDSDKSEEIKKHTHSIGQSVSRMDRMIESLLEFTRTGFTAPKLSVINIAQIADAALKGLEPGIREKSAEVTADLSGVVTADPDLMERVFENLIGNSLKYSRDDIRPRIEITSWQEEKWVNVSIADNGIGIDPQYAERVFEPFQRLHGSSEQYEGSGIGLSLVKSVIDAHKGQVWIDPQYTDGTRFIIRLPKAVAPAEVERELELA